jgi:hypothetical protein
VFNGLAQAIVQTNRKSGKIRFEAEGIGLKRQVLTLSSR